MTTWTPVSPGDQEQQGPTTAVVGIAVVGLAVVGKEAGTSEPVTWTPVDPEGS